MTRHLFLTGLLLTLTTSKGWACDCDYGGPFLKMAPYTKLIAFIKVTKHLTFKDIDGDKTPMSMEVEIIETYKGIESRRTVTVWGDPGHLCRPYLSTFKEGKHYVIALSPGYPNNGHVNEKATDYSIGNCGAFWLTVDIQKKIALGDIDSKDRRFQEIALSNLKSKLEKNGH